MVGWYSLYKVRVLSGSAGGKQIKRTSFLGHSQISERQSWGKKIWALRWAGGQDKQLGQVAWLV